MFSISFTDEPPDYLYDDPHVASQSGLLVLGNQLEGFSANLGTWDRSAYEEHWLRQLSALAEGQTKVGLVVSYAPSSVASNFELWALYRDGEIVHFQNHMPWYDSFPPSFHISAINDHLKDREVITSEGNKISEWVLSVRDIQLFLRRPRRPLLSHIP